MTNHEMIASIKIDLWQRLYSTWLTTELFSFTWWFSVLFLGISYFLWWKLLDKSKLVELLLFGSLIAVVSSFIDLIAENLVLWQYTVKILPFSPAFFPFHLTLAPLVLMLVYQYSDSWNKFLRYSVIAGGIYAFAIIPLFVLVGESRLIHWNYFNNFITFLARAIFCRWILLQCMQIQTSYQGQSANRQFFRPIYQPTSKPVPPSQEDCDKNSKN